MKKLSFIMAVLMILMCMPIMAISAAEEEVVAPDANAPTDIKEIHRNLNEVYWLYEYASDEEAIADGAIGRFCKEGYYGYAKTWTAVAAQAQDCGATVFYVIKDRVEVDAIGRDTAFDIGSRSLVIDGALGQANSEYGFTLVSGDRFLHANAPSKDGEQNRSSLGRPAASLTFKNFYIDAKAVSGAFIQCNTGAKVPSLTFDNIFVDAPNSSNGFIFWAEGTYVLNNVNADFPKKDSQAVRLDGGSNQNLTIKGSTLRGVTRGVYSTSNNSKIVIENSNLTNDSTSRGAVQYNGGSNAELTIYSGTFTGGYGFVIQNAPNLVVNLYGGTYNARNANGVQLQGNSAATVNIHGGIWNSKQHSVYVNGGKEPLNLNITGGTFIGNASRMIRATGNASNVISISGGTFISKNFDTDTNAFSGTPTPQFGLIFTELNNVINVSGGNFTAYKDDSVTLATETPFFCSWKNGDVNPKVNITGGTFKGGSCFLLEAVYSNDKAAPLDAEKSVWHYYDEGSNSVSMAPVATQGASVRLNKENSGLRFTATISGLTVKYFQEKVIKEGTELSYGTMIVPSDYVKYAGGELTMEAFDKAGKAYLNIEAKDGVIVNEDGSVTINAAMINIKKENYDRDFIAVAYIKYVDKAGAEVIKYATNVNLAAFSRNVQEIAHAALSDVLTTSAGTYVNKVDGYYTWNQNARKYEFTPGTAYSRYNAEQIAVLESYILPDAE